MIGLELSLVPAFLAYESKSLLIGERASLSLIDSVSKLAQIEPALEEVAPPLTLQMGADRVLVNLEIEFKKAAPVLERERAMHRIEEGIRARFPEVAFVFFRSHSMAKP